MQPHITRLISGGQTGADRAALDAALAHHLAYGGWCPAGGWAEDLPRPPGLLAHYPGLRPADSPDPAVRTRLNVMDSDATLIVRAADVRSAGSDLTAVIATEHQRPLLVTPGEPQQVIDWLRGLPPGLTLNVAGPRESGQPGIYQTTRQLLSHVLARLDQAPHRLPDGDRGPIP